MLTDDLTILMQADGRTSIAAMLLYGLEENAAAARESMEATKGRLWKDLGSIVPKPEDNGTTSCDMGGAPPTCG